MSAQIRSATERRAPCADLLAARAECWLQLGEPRRALVDGEQALTLQRDSLPALLAAATADYQLGHDERALWRLDDAAAIVARLGDVGVADGARIDTLRGRALLAAGRAPAAAAALERVLALPGRHAPDVFLDLARAYGAGGQASAALQRGLDELGPVVALSEAAIELDLAAGAFDRALARVDAVARHAQRQRPWHLRRAAILVAAGRGEAAQRERALADLESDRATAATAPVAPSVMAAATNAAANAATTLTAQAGGAGLTQLAGDAGAATAPLVEQVLLPAGSTWRYRDNNSISGSAWTSSTFDDSAWAQGPAQLGYGDGDEATVVGFGPSSTSRYITTWFRRHVQVVDPSIFATARVRLLRDDGAVVYLNGVEIARSNMPTGAIVPATLASTAVGGADESTFFSLPFDPARLVAGDNVLAVELHQNAANSTDLSFDLELLADTAPVAITRGPYLQDLTPSSAVVRWRTAVPTATQLWLGLAPNALQPVFFDATWTTEHAARVVGLPNDLRLYYAIGDRLGPLAGGDAQHSLTTLPPAGAVRPLRLWALGDAGTASAGQLRVRDAFASFAANRPADLMLMLGDNAYSTGTDLQFQAGVFDVYPAFLRNTCVWPTLGNHDAGSASSSTQTGVYYDIFDLPRLGEAGGLPSGTEAYYSFDRGHVHFVCLDSQDSDRTATGAMLQWLQADLASTAATWVIAFFHHPPYTKGSHDSDDVTDSGGRMRDMREQALPILEAAGVDLVLTGHSHDYERSYLLDGHYGASTTLQPIMVLDRGDGDEGGDGSYQKPLPARAPHRGAVYVVAGSSGQVATAPLDHPAMYIGIASMGSLCVDIGTGPNGDRLDGTFVTDTGAVADRFTIEKGPAPALTRDVPSLSIASGGTQRFTLQAGAQHAGLGYVLGGSFGTAPGLQLGSLHVPLNLDGWLSASVGAANSATYPGSFGVLDGNGAASAAFVLPPVVGSSLLGQSLWHAFVVFDGSGFRMASNAVRVRFAP